MKKPLRPTRWAEALAGGEVVGQGPRATKVGEVDAGLGGDEGGAEGAEDPVERGRAAPRLGSEPVEQVEGVQLGEAHPGAAFPGEADVGHLWRGEHTVVIEEPAQVRSRSVSRPTTARSRASRSRQPRRPPTA